MARLKDLRSWFVLAKEGVSKEEADTYCDYLESFLKNHREIFENQLSKEMTKDGDIHSRNAVFSNEEFHLLDTFPPKEEWSIGHPAISLYRLGADIFVFGGRQSLFEEFLKGYQEIRGSVTRYFEPFYMLYASSIMLAYQYHLAESDPKELNGARLYHKFMQEYFKKHI